jgi:hypothetical protein
MPVARALAFADFRRAVEIADKRKIRFIELSALRQEELSALFHGIERLDPNKSSEPCICGTGNYD